MALPDVKNDQEVFEFVAAHLFRQGKRSRGDEFNCMYRGPGGTSCAVGCLIPDSVYDPVMDHTINPTNFESLYRNNEKFREYFEGCNVDLMVDLQGVHDDPFYWNNGDLMRAALTRVGCRHYHLNIEFLQDLDFGDR